MVNLRHLLAGLVDFNFTEILSIGKVVIFMYYPLFGFNREYTALITSLDKKTMGGRILDVNPHPLLPVRENKSFSRKRMNVKDYYTPSPLSIKLSYIESTPHEDEHRMEG